MLGFRRRFDRLGLNDVLLLQNVQAFQVFVHLFHFAVERVVFLTFGGIERDVFVRRLGHQLVHASGFRLRA